MTSLISQKRDEVSRVTRYSLIDGAKGLLKVVMVIMSKELGSKIVRDLIAKGCTKWKIMREMQRRENKPDLAYNTVMAWERGLFCADEHIPHLQAFRYEWCVKNGFDPFNG